MSSSLNALFRPSGDPVAPQEGKMSTDQVKAPAPRREPQKATPRATEAASLAPVPVNLPAARQTSQTASPRVRKERADKKKDIKFPVTPEQREELRRLAKELRKEQKEPSRKFETISNTILLKKALEQQAIFPERYPPLLYKDTGQYMHAEPILADYGLVEELSLKWNLSLRKTVYRLLMNVVYRGEVDSDAYRAGK